MCPMRGRIEKLETTSAREDILKHDLARQRALLAGAAVLALWPTSAALAQGASDEAIQADGAARTLETVTVTARRREERLQDVPVVVSSFGKDQIDAFGAEGFEDISALTPSLVIDESGGAEGLITLRGISTGGLNASSDQAVSINIDGVQFSNATALRFGQYDVEQIDVLKGPQALFFGKNSPGGILSLRTSDPTDTFLFELGGGYEFSAAERFGEAVISGSILQTLGGRLYLRASDEDGPYENVAPGAVRPDAQETSTFFGRATLNWTPDDRFTSRFKLAYGTGEGAPQGIEQRFGCEGSGLPGPINGPVDNCQLDEVFVTGDPDPALAALSPLFSAEPEGETRMLLTSLELSVELTDSLTLTSLTGYSDLRYSNYGNTLPTLAPIFVSGFDQDQTSLSQEIRLTSTFEGPVNFMIGAFFDDRSFDIAQALLVPAPAPPFPPGARLLFENDQSVDSDSQSAFGQLLWDVTPTIEISAGARYTSETRTLSGTGALSPGGFGLVLPASFAPPAVPTGAFQPSPDEVSYDNWSPEVSIAWRPHERVTLFAAYKEGFKSGGFNTSVNGSSQLAAIPSDQSFAEETVDGFEVGIKSSPRGNLRLNAAAFSYTYDNLQLSTFDFAGGGISTRVVNTGAAKTEGFELDGIWSPDAIDGLTITGGLSFNDTEYTEDVFFPCNGPQIAGQMAGCDFLTQLGGVIAVAPGSGNAQNLQGLPLLRAPEWSGSLSAAYEGRLTSSLRYRLNGNTSYSGSYQTNNRYDPRAEQDAFWLFNASLGLMGQTDRWSIDLIGRNLTDEIVLTGSGGVVPVGGTVPGVSAGELQGPASRPRSVLLQFSYRFFGE